MAIRFGLLTSPGIGSAVEHELRLRGIPFTELKSLWMRNHDLLIVSSERSALKELLKLRSAEDVFVILNEEVSVEEKQELGKLTPRKLRKAILESLPMLPPRKTSRATTHFAVFVKQDQDQEIYRREIEAAVGAYLLEEFNKWKVMEPADIEFWAFYVKKKITLGMRLTKISFRKRSYREEDRPGSLRPIIAGALVALSDPSPGQVVLDPMCGAGTILLERGAWDDGARLIGCDIDSRAIEIARASADKAGLEIEFLDHDSTKAGFYPELTGTVSRIITNLPFGKQFNPEDLGRLYQQALTAWRPLLKPGGKMILLTSEERTLRSAAKGMGLFVKPIEKVRIKGLEAQVFLLG